jgi:DNA helicase HerA-like ATPase
MSVSSGIVGKVFGKTTPYGFDVKLDEVVHRNAYLAVEHEDKTFILSVQKLWNNNKGSFAECTVVGQVPLSPFAIDAEISVATADQVKLALGMDVPSDKAIEIGKILHTDILATPSIEKMGRVFITGKSGSGKSYTVGVIIEEIMKKEIPIVIIDRHGEYSSLKVLEKDNIPDNESYFDKNDPQRKYAETIIEFGDIKINPGCDLELKYLLASEMGDLVLPGHTIIVNLRGVDLPIQESIIEKLCARIYKASTMREIPPHYIFIDEAHLFAGKKSSDTVETLKLIAQEGRKFGSNLVVITQKPQALDTTIRAQAGTWIIHKLTDIRDVKITCSSAEGLSSEADDTIQNLAPGECIITGDITPFCPILTKIRLRYTQHGGAGYNVLDNINDGDTLPKAQLVEQLRNSLSNDELDEAKNEVFTGKRLSVAELYGRIDDLRKNNLDMKQKIADLESKTAVPVANTSQGDPADIQKLKTKIDDLEVEIQTLQLVELEVEEWKTKFNAEKKTADNAIALSEKLMIKLKKRK